MHAYVVVCATSDRIESGSKGSFWRARTLACYPCEESTIRSRVRDAITSRERMRPRRVRAHVKRPLNGQMAHKCSHMTNTHNSKTDTHTKAQQAKYKAGKREEGGVETEYVL